MKTTMSLSHYSTYERAELAEESDKKNDFRTRMREYGYYIQGFSSLKSLSDEREIVIFKTFPEIARTSVMPAIITHQGVVIPVRSEPPICRTALYVIEHRKTIIAGIELNTTNVERFNGYPYAIIRANAIRYERVIAPSTAKNESAHELTFAFIGDTKYPIKGITKVNGLTYFIITPYPSKVSGLGVRYIYDGDLELGVFYEFRSDTTSY